MNTEIFFTLNRQALIALAVTAAFPVTSIAAAGRVEFAIGGATAISADGAARQLNKGVEINTGDTIKTTDGRVQVRFTDGGYMSFQPNTEFKIENYSYGGKQDGSEKGFFRLVEGGLRVITGIVGRNNRPAYRVATPVATIGIRGSEFLAEHRDSKLKVRVIGGSIYIENENGDLILFKGQSAEASEGEKPSYSDEESGVLAKGPEGGGPGTGQDESKQEQENAKIFTVNEQYNEEGSSCALTNSCTNTSIIAQYAAATAVGYYNGSTSSISGLNGGVTGTAVGYLTAEFGEYKVINDLIVTLQGGFSGASGSSLLSGNGGIGPDGSIFIPLMTAGSGGICGGSGCKVENAVGIFSGAQAENALITYGINGVSSDYASGQIETTVPYNASQITADGGDGAVLYDDGGGI